LIIKQINMAERVGFEFTRKRSFNNIESAAGTVKQWKAIVSSANGSQTDHNARLKLRLLPLSFANLSDSRPEPPQLSTSAFGTETPIFCARA
jgi:hypothetical protein